MPYPPHHQRQMPIAKEEEKTEFTRADGSVEVQGSFTKTTGPVPDADIATQIAHRKTELSCGCYWPDVEIGGVCAECGQQGTSPNVCTRHFVVCGCGTPTCWKHSHASEGGTPRLCQACHRREKNKALKAAASDLLRRAARRIFFK